MPGDIGLIGGDEFRRGCEDMDREIMGASGQDPARVLIVPTAALDGPVRAADNGVRHFNALGSDARRLMVLERAHAEDPGLIQSSQGAGVVYFTGGSPDHLLATLRDSALLKTLLAAVDQGAVLAGSSAGAMVMGSHMRRPGGGDWVEALGIVPGIAVLPHHESRDPAEVSRQLRSQSPAGLTVLGIDARTGCLGRPGRWQVVGQGKVIVYRGADWAVYGPGGRLPGDV
ncbi:MAG: Type 1 glutamine amidotransferase-like domain-containing protein [Dehalococcoidia bacterium]|nr:Type 1 glutamine amidotransferase-like domain-containing protein [Dehalococcoidia bacterium]MDP7084537.1 Type 1 glutamine amidotransferase-like domain-containing protein [Dehalococcoidia bacterium]MDP7511976.1 Type 1 glutamine amidotransferase-like domain-containing protein [Dehalococcoidia bacterium]HJN87630.1 Type 1 glutamine amidotransferase-like domain-containing protein [Dehalococcoidia bacterium]